MNETYLTHEIKQSTGWTKIAEYACKSREHAAQIEREIRARHPADEARFTVRG